MKSILKSIQINNICGYIIDKIDNIEIISMFSILYLISALKKPVQSVRVHVRFQLRNIRLVIDMKPGFIGLTKMLSQR